MNLLKLCSQFKVLAMEENDPQKLLSLLGEGLSKPDTEDQKDIIILMNRASKALAANNVKLFIEIISKFE